MRESLEITLSKEMLERDLRKVLGDSNWKAELDSGTIILRPDVEAIVVARSFHSYEYDMEFGDHFRALIAVGGIKKSQMGILEAGICFASMWYKPDGKLITIDFSKNIL